MTKAQRKEWNRLIRKYDRWNKRFERRDKLQDRALNEMIRIAERLEQIDKEANGD